MSADAGDKTRAGAAEQAIKAALTVGISGFTAPVMTVAEYTIPEAPNAARDVNRSTAAGVFEALRSLPVRLPSHGVPDVPPASAHTGALIYVTNGAAGLPIVAFSDGTSWLRVDTRTAISP